MSCYLATASSCAVILFARHAQAFQLAPSSLQSTRIKTLESSASTHHAAPLSWAKALPRRRRQRSFGTTMLSGSGGRRDDGVGGGESWFSEWKQSLVAASVALSIFSGGVLTTWPGVMLQDGSRSSGSAALAAMAPSLMQDEKGYISIFEKVISHFALKPHVAHISTLLAYNLVRRTTAGPSGDGWNMSDSDSRATLQVFNLQRYLLREFVTQRSRRLFLLRLMMTAHIPQRVFSKPVVPRVHGIIHTQYHRRNLLPAGRVYSVVLTEKVSTSSHAVAKRQQLLEHLSEMSSRKRNKGAALLSLTI